MILPHLSNPGLIASTDETRYVITFVKVENGFAIATDGRRLIVQEVHPEVTDERTELYLTPAMTKAARKIARHTAEDAKLDIGADTVSVQPLVSDGPARTWTDTKDPGIYPDWVGIVPDLGARIRIGINAEFLLQLSKAMQGNTESAVYLDIDPTSPTTPIIVTTQWSGSFGLIMPCRDKWAVTTSEALLENRAWQYAARKAAARQTEIEAGYQTRHAAELAAAETAE